VTTKDQIMKKQKLDRIGKLARTAAIAAAIVWLAGALFIPRDVQAAIEGWWSGVLLSLVCIGLVVWSLASLLRARDQES
jgi:amino acid transporter